MTNKIYDELEKVWKQGRAKGRAEASAPWVPPVNPTTAPPAQEKSWGVIGAPKTRKNSPEQIRAEREAGRAENPDFDSFEEP